MRFLDTHHHLWDISLRPYDWINQLPKNESRIINRNFLHDDLIEISNTNRIDGTICVQAHQSEDEAFWILDLAKNSDVIKGVVCWVDLKGNNLEHTLDKYQSDNKFVGIRHVWHDEKNEDWILDEKVLNGLKVLSKRGINFDFLVRPNHLKYIFEVYEKVPELKGVINHIAKPYVKESIFDPWAKEMQELSKIDSLHCKLSGMVEEMSESQGISILKSYTDHVIDSFSVDKVMYGSNWPVCLIKKSYSEVLDIAKNISTNLDFEKIFYTNGKKFYLD